MDSIDRLPPQSREAEKGVLGALFREGMHADAAFALLEPGDFYWDHHAKIYRVFVDHAAAGKPFDLVSCYESLRERKQIDDGLSAAYLGELWESVPTGANLEYHARIVRERSMRRRLIHLATEAIRDAYDTVGDAEELYDSFAAKIFEACSDKRLCEPVTLGEAMSDVLRDIDERSRPGGPKPIPTGFDSLDQVLGGWRPDELTYIAARPSVGKSAIAASFLLAAAEEGKSAYIFSLEVPYRDLASRILAMKSDVPLNLIRGRVYEDQPAVQRLLRAADETRLPIWIDDRPDHTIASIAAVARRAVRKHGVGLIVIDYLQLIEPESRREPREQQVATISRRLKILSRTLHVPIICLCQLNRECENRADGRPQLSDLRESGSLEQDGDSVLMLWPQPVGDAQPSPAIQEIRVCVEKQRNGPKTVVPLVYRRAFTRFEQRTPIL